MTVTFYFITYFKQCKIRSFIFSCILGVALYREKEWASSCIVVENFQKNRRLKPLIPQ
jgi:hypothetical protein